MRSPSHQSGWYDSGDVPVPAERPKNLGDTLRNKLCGSNIFLSGLPGSRKAEVGKMLAKSLRYKFLDLPGMLVQACRSEHDMTVWQAK